MARKPAATFPVAGQMEWLGRVREVRHALDPSHPLRVKTQDIISGGHLQPTIPFPERHPYCEIDWTIKGSGDVFIGTERARCNSGNVILIGPGVPHYGKYVSYPNYGFTVHFLPILLFEMSPIDGARILTRFTASQSIAQRVIHLPKMLQAKLSDSFKSMAEEFENPRFGSDLSARIRLMDALVSLIRWEESVGKAIPHQPAASNWGQIEKILQFMYNHYTEPLYIEQIAREVGLSVKDLRRLFRETFGMSCIQYLSAYRISHAASMLCLPGARITEVGPAVGFETLSHFNSAFRISQGMSPTEFVRSHKSVN